MKILYKAEINLEINLNSLPYFNDEIRQAIIKCDKEEVAKGIENDLINAIRQDYTPDEGTIEIKSTSLVLQE